MKFKNSISFRLATVFGISFRMRSDLLVNNFVEVSLREKKSHYLNLTLEETLFI